MPVMFDLVAWIHALAALLIVAVAGWLVSLPLRNVSLVDTLWSLKFLLCAVIYAALQPQLGPRGQLCLLLVGVWALRLALYITWRNRHADDRRLRVVVDRANVA